LMGFTQRKRLKKHFVNYVIEDEKTSKENSVLFIHDLLHICFYLL
jgi:hypothetical protein